MYGPTNLNVNEALGFSFLNICTYPVVAVIRTLELDQKVMWTNYTTLDEDHCKNFTSERNVCCSVIIDRGNAPKYWHMPSPAVFQSLHRTTLQIRKPHPSWLLHTSARGLFVWSFAAMVELISASWLLQRAKSIIFLIGSNDLGYGISQSSIYSELKGYPN